MLVLIGRFMLFIHFTLQEREKRRMEDGKAISKLRQELNDQEIKKIAAERKREKQETADAKRRVLEQIEADKRARQMERDGKYPKLYSQHFFKWEIRKYGHMKKKLNFQHSNFGTKILFNKNFSEYFFISFR